MKTSRHSTTVSFEEESLDLQHEKTTLVNLYLTLKAFFSGLFSTFSKTKIAHYVQSTVTYVASGAFIKTVAVVMSFIWLLIIVSTLFL